MKNFLNKLFKKSVTIQPEEKYIVTISDEYVRVEHSKYKPEQVSWAELKVVKLINTNAGPLAPDIWLTLMDNNSTCFIPHGSKGFDDVYAVISKYEGFRLENVIKSMACTENAEFLLWERI